MPHPRVVEGGPLTPWVGALCEHGKLPWRHWSVVTTEMGNARWRRWPVAVAKAGSVATCALFFANPL